MPDPVRWRIIKYISKGTSRYESHDQEDALVYLDLIDELNDIRLDSHLAMLIYGKGYG